METTSYVKFNFILFMTILFSIFGLWSCQPSNKIPDLTNPTINLPSVANSNNQHTNTVRQDANQITADAVVIKKIVETNYNITEDANGKSAAVLSSADMTTIDNKATNIQEHSSRILTTSYSIDDNSKKLIEIQSIFDKKVKELCAIYEKKYAEAEKQIKALLKENEHLKDANNQKQKFIYNILKTVAGIGIAAGIALFFLGHSKMGVPITFASVTLLAVTIFLQRFELYIALAAGIILIVLICYILYNAWKNGKLNLTKEKALKEVVCMIDEHIKPSMTKESIEKVFGPITPPPPPVPLANKIQSETTKKLVATIRGKVEKK